MITFRGDAHKFYLKLKKAVKNDKEIFQLPEIKEIHSIDQFYDQLSDADLTMIRYRMLKEKDGNGIIPILISALPWLGFLLSKQLQNFLMKSYLYILSFLILYTVITTVSVIIHYREKAWAAIHVDIIDHHLKERKKTNKNH
ncbi:hypothetical protein JOD45_001802 [Scopulibacillus daqui]|uniref:Uncharacterized protein n=1 Tax=Scopulibacillus daqui TaxID=1469162 RepID=A0ABS2PZV4_9BACL|nr:hypothetical protein [Scopulibacillus daqui]MBM7645584.1 hypothetical protein [Scopulibacillus daqui]